MKFSRILLILASILTNSCFKSKENNIPQTLSFDINTCKSITFLYDSKSYNFIKSKDSFINSKHRYKLSNNKLKLWEQEANSIKIEENSKGASLVGISPRNIFCQKDKNSKKITGYQLKGPLSLVTVQTEDDRNSLYIKSADFSKLFKDVNQLRDGSLKFSMSSKLEYVFKKKKLKLEKNLKENLLRAINSFEYNEFVFDGVVNQGVLNTFKFQRRINSNLLGYFLIDGKKIMISREDPDRFDVYIWHEGSLQITKGLLSDFFILKRFEMENFLNN